MKARRILIGASALMLACGAVSAQTPPATPPSQSAPTREDYDKLRQEQDQLRQELRDLRQQLQEERAARTTAPSQPAGGAANPAAQKPPEQEFATREDTDDLEKQIKTIHDQVEQNRMGTSAFHLAGDGEVGFTSQKHNKSTFDASIAPLILWKPDERILIEAGFDIGIATDDNNSSETSFDLTLANISYLVNDNLVVGGGLFVVPFGVYHRHFDPPWINKFPDDPLPFADGGIAPAEEVGFFAGGALPVHNMKLTYDFYLTNGPNLYTNNDNGNAGELNFDDFTDLNNGKAVGGRIGFLPMPNLEVGYSAMFAKVDPGGFPSTDAFLQAVDLNWRLDVPALKGQFDTRTEWVWSNVERATYDPTGSLGFGPTNFSNYRHGGYVQLCYRPTMVDNKFLKNLEFVSRYDILRSSEGAQGGDREERLTLGVDYWITPAVVFKTAYEFDDKRGGDSQNAFLMQIGFGL